jgi:ParB family transcriptional regulator, chromosome partitioning protein
MTTSNTVTTGPTTGKTGPEKVADKVAEKRRALGRGLDSLLPGPRVVPPASTLPQSARKDSAPLTDADSWSPAATSIAEIGGGQAGVSPTPAEGTPTAPLQGVALESVQAVAASEGEHAFELPLNRIDENPYQTRQEFDPKALSDLAGSIQTQGVLQPIVVRPAPIRQLPTRDGGVIQSEQHYILILGERRFRASKIAGKTTIPAIVKRVSDQQAAEMTLVENLQRLDLDCLEQANAFAKLSTGFNLTQEEIGKRVGVSREQVSNYLRLLKLPSVVLTALRTKDLTYSHARLLLSLTDNEQIAKVAQIAITKKMSVALLTDLVMSINVPSDTTEERQHRGAQWVDPNVRAAQRSLETVLGMRVRIRDRKGKGKITIEYGTLEDFDRVVSMLGGK